MEAQETRMFSPGDLEKLDVRQTLRLVCSALEEKGYRPVDQIVGYLVSGDPAYITGHNNARLLMQRLERDELLEEIVGLYLDELREEL